MPAGSKALPDAGCRSRIVSSKKTLGRRNFHTANIKTGEPTGSVALAVLLIVLGVVAVISPLFATVVLIRVIGWLLIFAAIEQTIHIVRTRDEGGLFFKILVVVLYAIVGVMLLRRPVSGAIAATAIIGILFLADGIMEIALGLQLRGRYAKTGWLVAGGIMSLLFGAIVLYQLPLSAMWVIGVLVGIRLIFKGVGQIVRSSAGTGAQIDRRAA